MYISGFAYIQKRGALIGAKHRSHCQSSQPSPCYGLDCLLRRSWNPWNGGDLLGALANAANDKELSQHDLKQKASRCLLGSRVVCLDKQLRSTVWSVWYTIAGSPIWIQRGFVESTADLGKRHFGHPQKWRPHTSLDRIFIYIYISYPDKRSVDVSLCVHIIWSWWDWVAPCFLRLTEACWNS